jgi:hypothetical protein
MKAWGFFCFSWMALALGLGGAAAGCGSSNSSGTAGGSAEGQSCTKTDDCQSMLVCLANTCVKGPSLADASVSSGDTGGGGPDVAPPLRLSQIGEACQRTGDCAPGLDCVVSTNGGTVCDIVSYKLPSGNKTCSGECASAADCCELPVNVSLETITDAGIFNFVQVHNCQDVLQAVLGGDPAVCNGAPTIGSTIAIGCFYYQTYCKCSANTWACTNNKCVYTASCQSSVANDLGGCPTATRASAGLSSVCDLPGNKCHSAGGGCAMDSDCDGKSVSDVVGATCRGGDCACYQNACYLKCVQDLDCQSGSSCDTATTKLCVPATCMTDGDCVAQLNQARAKCNAGACKIPCTIDHDCSPSGDVGQLPFNGKVCAATGFCEPIGCTSDANCPPAPGTGVRQFCVAPTTMTTVHSAITN